METSVKAENINNSFFDGYYKDIWKNIFPEKTTLAEVDFILTEVGEGKQIKILDLMCGNGRHAIELAKRGASITAVDNLAEYIREIKERTADLNLPVEAILADVMDFEPAGNFDAIMCMGNSLQFFDRDDTSKLLNTIYGHLVPGGKLFINTWSIAEIVFRNFKDKTWGRMNNLLFLSESRILFNPTRMETDSIIITDDGQREEKKGIDYIYSISEIESLLETSGLKLKEIYSIPGKKQFTVGDPRAYIVAVK